MGKLFFSRLNKEKCSDPPFIVELSYFENTKDKLLLTMYSTLLDMSLPKKVNTGPSKLIDGGCFWPRTYPCIFSSIPLHASAHLQLP